MIKDRPTEVGTGVAAAIAFLLGRIFGWDGDVQGALILVLAFLPGAITWLVVTLRHSHSPGSRILTPDDF